MTCSLAARKRRKRANHMGAVSTKKKEYSKWKWAGRAGHHSPYPVDLVPYPAPDLLYCYIDFLASYKYMCNTVNLGPQAVTTNVDAFKEEFMNCYSQGFVLNTFLKVPGVHSTIHSQDWSDKHPYQAIFSKLSNSNRSQETSWEIKIDKHILSMSTLFTGEEADENDLMTAIDKNALLGVRLACAQPIGYVESSSSNEQYKVMGVELFFNIPRHKNPKIYKYHVLRKPTIYTVVADATQSLQQIECDADWLGQLKVFLDRGWKLIDICMDAQALADAFGMKTASRMIESIWLFEKEESRLEEQTAQYEGAIIEYMHKIRVDAVGDEAPCRDWRPVIAGMGVSGWELATVVQTPILIQSSFSTYTIKLLLFFQRRIIPEHHEMIDNYLRTQALHNRKQTQQYSYIETLPNNLDRKNKVNNKKEGYYNHTLNQYIYSEDGGDRRSTDEGPVGLLEELGAVHTATNRGRRGAAVSEPNGFIPGQNIKQ